MDRVVSWASPLTVREVLTIVAFCAAAIIVGLLVILIPLRRRINAWAASQQCQVMKLQALSSYRRWFNTVYRVTVRDRSGRHRVATLRFVGFELFPTRIDAEWEDAP